MPWYDYLLEEGYVPKGATPKTISLDTGKPEIQPQGNMARIALGLTRFMQRQKAQQEAEEKRFEKKLDMYKTLREAGYNPKGAYEAIQKGVLPEPSGEKSIKEQQAEAELGKTKAQTEYYKKRLEPDPLKEQKAQMDKETAQKRIELVNAQIEKLKQSKEADPLKAEKTLKEIEKLNAEIDKLKRVPEKTKSESQKFREDLQAARQGKIDWEDLEMDYPDRIDTIKKIRKQVTPVGKSPEFREGRGLEALRKPNVAKMTPKAKNMIAQIKTEADLDEFLEDVDEMIEAGKFTDNDKRTVMEYFGIAE